MRTRKARLGREAERGPAVDVGEPRGRPRCLSQDEFCVDAELPVSGRGRPLSCLQSLISTPLQQSLQD